MKMRADLHIHSKYSSDGEKSPQELAAIAKSKNLAIIALCDHETTAGTKEMMEAAADLGITAIPGIELNGEIDGDIAHILGLGLDPESTRFDNNLAAFEEHDKDATDLMIRLFRDEFSMDFDFALMRGRCLAANWNMLPLVDELLTNPKYRNMEKIQTYLPGGEKSDFPAGSMYWDYCLKGQPLYIPPDIPNYKKVIEEIHQDGGIAILAHPFNLFYEQYEYLQAMKDAGLDGIEAYSNYHDDSQNAWYHQYCLEQGLLVSGGSDYHGAYKPHVVMGEFSCRNQEEVLADILKVLLKK